MSDRRILAPNRNCWTDRAHADAAGLLIDADNYYRAFHHAARQARRSLLIAGWRFNSDVRLLRGPDGDVHFLPFLRELVADNPELQVHVLAWDFSINYALEWERFQGRKFERGAHGHIHFLFDAEHAVGGSHHQKLVVIDDRLAFVGGLDFCADDWDDRRHLADNADRRDSGQPPHGPYHDVQAFVTGPAAAELAEYFRARWELAGGEPLLSTPSPLAGEDRGGGEEAAGAGPSSPPPRPSPARGEGERTVPELPFKPSVRLPVGPVGLSLSHPPTLTNPEATYQIRALFRDAILAAEELIYLENQYFSSQAVYQALIDRMETPGRPQLDVAIVLPKKLHSWVEATAVDPPRVRYLEGLTATARRTGHRLGLYYTAPPGADGAAVLIHSKVLVVDDSLLTVGSANASNRSLGLDTELNLVWEADGPAAGPLGRAIRRARVELLAEHCGVRHDRAARRYLARRQGLVAYLDGLADAGTSRLHRLTTEAVCADRDWLKHLARLGFAYDPEGPAIEETLHEALEGAPDSTLARGLVWLRDKLRPAGSAVGEE